MATTEHLADLTPDEQAAMTQYILAGHSRAALNWLYRCGNCSKWRVLRLDTHCGGHRPLSEWLGTALLLKKHEGPSRVLLLHHAIYLAHRRRRGGRI